MRAVIVFENLGVTMKIDDSYEKRCQNLYRFYPVLGYLYDDGNPSDHGQLSRPKADAEFLSASNCAEGAGTASGKRGHLILICVALAALIALGFGSSYLRNYWIYCQSYESTGVARVVAQTTPIKARIDGTIAGLYVEPFQRVKAGQLLAQIDPREREIAVEQARAQLSQAETNLNVSQQRYALDLAKIREALTRDLEGRQEQQRYLTLLRMGVISRTEYEQQSTNTTVMGTAVKSDQAEAAVALSDIAVCVAQLHTAKAGLDQAILNLGYTRIVAPADGIIGLYTGELGQRIEPGDSVMVLNRLDDLWVTADFKEKQLAQIHGDQTVTIHVDALGRDFRGHIQSMPEVGGTLSSLLPDGEFSDSYVRGVRRFAVPIRFDKNQDLSGLRPGMSVQPTVWLKPNLK
jgi:membrane fusion protein, multidrug efflux system